MSLAVRKAIEADAAAIVRVGRASFYDTFVNLFTSHDELERYLDLTYNADRIQKSISKQNNSYFLALINEEVAGFAKIKKTSRHEVIKSENQSELQRIYVLRISWLWCRTRFTRRCNKRGTGIGNRRVVA